MLLNLFIILEDITKLYKSSSKKRDISVTSKTDEDSKKIREASSAGFTDEGDVFMKVLIRCAVERFYLIV